MSDSQYSELDKLVREYEEDTRTIKDDRLVMKNYPKVFTMSAASLFEYHIKNKCQEFLNSPKLSIDSNYHKISLLRRKNRPLIDQMYSKLEGYSDAGIEHLSAEKFYELFNGQIFKDSVKDFFAWNFKSGYNKYWIESTSSNP